jgi:hypothetical protein
MDINKAGHAASGNQVAGQFEINQQEFGIQIACL